MEQRRKGRERETHKKEEHGPSVRQDAARRKVEARQENLSTLLNADLERSV